MSTTNKRRLAAIAVGSATAVLAGATTGVGAATAAPAAGQVGGARLAASTPSTTGQSQLTRGRAALATKGHHVTAAKVAMPAKKKKKRGKRSRMS